jgi:hypothetical protein
VAAQVEDLARMDLDVRGLALEPARRLVDQDARVGEGEALAPRAAREQQRAHAHRHAEADRLHLGRDELHGVVDRQAGVDRAAGRVDVQGDVLVGVLGLQVQQLRHHEVGDLLVDRLAEEDDALVEQAGVDVERPLSARALLDDHRDQRHTDLLSSVWQPRGCRSGAP